MSGRSSAIKDERVLKIGEFEGQIIRRSAEYKRTVYTVKRLNGPWPDNGTLMDACRLGGAPFGGHVGSGDNSRVVTVYED